jgi:hypothetical protein
LICELNEVSNATNKSSVTVDLTQPLEDYYIDENGVEVGIKGWDLKLSESTNSRPILTEPLRSRNRDLMNFVCRMN